MPDVRRILKCWSLTQTQFGRIIGVHPVTVCHWCAGRSPRGTQIKVLEILELAFDYKEPEIEIIERIYVYVVTGRCFEAYQHMLEWSVKAMDIEDVISRLGCRRKSKEKEV